MWECVIAFNFPEFLFYFIVASLTRLLAWATLEGRERYKFDKQMVPCNKSSYPGHNESQLQGKNHTTTAEISAPNMWSVASSLQRDCTPCERL